METMRKAPTDVEESPMNNSWEPPKYITREEGGVMGGKYIGSSEQDAARDNELGALRKRVEELEQTSFDLCPNCGWRTAGPDGCFKERAEKAERERDNYRRDFDAAANAIDKLQADFEEADGRAMHAEGELAKVYEMKDRVEADLDAALRVAELLGWGKRGAEPDDFKHVETLLEKRRERGVCTCEIRGEHQYGPDCEECASGRKKLG